MGQNPEDLKVEIADLESRLERLKAQLPAHSLSPAMMIALDELEEQLAEARQRFAKISGKNDT
jgi:cell division septum initiation protein DivIVA